MAVTITMWCKKHIITSLDTLELSTKFRGIFTIFPTFRIGEPGLGCLAAVAAVIRVPGQTPLTSPDHADIVAEKYLVKCKNIIIPIH